MLYPYIASPYHPDSYFDVSTLSRLEAAGIPVVTTLQNNLPQFAAAIDVSSGAYHNVIGAYHSVMNTWIVEDEGSCPPTWRSLHGILKGLGLEELSQQIEEYLSCECP
jgi:hypothetical protein